MRIGRADRCALALLTAAACHGGAPVDTATVRAQPTVFTDSAMHARLCQPNKPGEDWRHVCTPLDQSATPVRPVAPPRM